MKTPMTINQLIHQQGETIYFTPIHVWADIHQPDPKQVFANPPYNTPIPWQRNSMAAQK